MGKVSNIQLKNGQTLMELALIEVNKRFDKIVEKQKGSFKITFEYGDTWDKNKIISYKLDIKFEDRGFGKPAGYMKQKFRNEYIIFVNTCYTDKEFLMDTFIHEITHVSQKLNGFLEYSNIEESERYKVDIVKKKKSSKVSLKKYYKNRHHENLAEHEAVLVPCLQLLKGGNITTTVKYMTNKPDYFHFEWREFIQKAYGYGVSKENIIKAKQAIIEVFENDISECKQMNSAYVWENYSRRFTERNTLMNMFGLGNSYWKALYELGVSISEDKPEFKMEQKLNYVKKQLSI